MIYRLTKVTEEPESAVYSFTKAVVVKKVSALREGAFLALTLGFIYTASRRIRVTEKALCISVYSLASVRVEQMDISVT